MLFITSIAFLVVAAAGVLAQPHIDTPPSIVQCQPTKLTFNGGSPPYFISILPGGQVGASAIEQLPSQSGTSFTWVADIASGTSITFSIKDSTGATGFSAIDTIQASSDNSCVGKNSLSSGSGSATAPASTASGSASSISSPATTTAPASISSTPASSAIASVTSASASNPASSAASSAASSGTAAAASSSSKPNAALSLSSGSAPGIIGMILAALLV